MRLTPEQVILECHVLGDSFTIVLDGHIEKTSNIIDIHKCQSCILKDSAELCIHSPFRYAILLAKMDLKGNKTIETKCTCVNVKAGAGFSPKEALVAYVANYNILVGHL